MKKLKLDLTELAVESFATASQDAPDGTVRAHDGSGADVSCDETTCGDSIAYTCPPVGGYCLPQSTFAPSCGGQLSCECTAPSPWCGEGEG